MKKVLKILTICATALALGSCDFPGSDKPTNEGENTNQNVDETVNVESVTLDKTTLDLHVTESVYLKATIAPENATNKYLIWTSSDEDVAMVSAIGKVTALKAGTAKIQAISQADSTKFAECTVNVTILDNTVHVTGVELDKESADLYVGESIKLNASVLPENATNKNVTFTSSDRNVAFVDASGSVAAIGAGTATITASSNENPELKAQCVINVTVKDETVHVDDLTVDLSSVELDLGGRTSVKPEVTISPENATNKNVTWTSSNSSKVIVDGEGNIHAVAVTTEPVVVTVKSVDNPAKSKTISVTVVDTRDHSIHVESVSLPKTKALDLKTNASSTLTASVLPTNAGNKEVNWVSSDPTVVALGEKIGESSINITGLKEGNSRITATSVDGEISDYCDVTVSDSTVYVNSVVIEHNSAVITDLDIELGSFERVTASVLPEYADNKNIVWELESGAEEYISLSATSGSNIMIFGNKATPEKASFVVYAISAENGEKKAEINVTVTDPTIYPTGVGIYVEGLSNKQTTASVENTKSIKLEAKIEPADATNQEIVWEVPTNDCIVTSENLDHTLNVLGRKETTEPIFIKAKAKSDAKVYSEIAISVINPKSIDRFNEFNNPASYDNYLGHINPTNLKDVEGLPSGGQVDIGSFYKYDDADANKYTYKVGNQGVFRFAPTATIFKANEDFPTQITNVSTSKRLILIDGATETDVTESMGTYVTIDDNGIDYTFKDAAVGKKFRLELEPDYSKYYSKTPVVYDNFTFEVIEGYNVDELAELSLFDNVQSAWNTYKAQNNLLGTTARGGIILHKDIRMTSDILPDGFKQSATDLANQKANYSSDFSDWAVPHFGSVEAGESAFVGSLKDYITLFNRTTKSEDFSFEGNFFAIDASVLKPVYLLDANSDTLPPTLANGLAGDGSHAQLFGINNDEGCPEIKSQMPTTEHYVTMRNFSFKGNGGLETDADGNINELKKGGLIAFKLSAADFNIENTVMSDTFISFLIKESDACAEYDLTNMHADRVTSYSSFSSMFYIWGAKDNFVTNSWLEKCGGPLVLLDEPNRAWFDTYIKESSMDCTNCFLKNEVMGTEPWFQGHDGSSGLVQNYIVSAGAQGGWYYNAASAAGAGARTIGRRVDSKTAFCNFIAIDVMASNFDKNDSRNLNGHFTINNGENKNLNMQMSCVARNEDSATALFPYSNLAGYVFSSREGTMANFDGTKLIDFHNLTMNQFSGGAVPGDTPLAAEGFFTNEYVSGFLNPAGQLFSNPKGKFIGVVLGTYAI